MTLAIANYVCSPDDDLSPADPNAFVFADVEGGCMTDPFEVEEALLKIRNAGLRPGIYASKSTAIEDLQNKGFKWPEDVVLWLADWGVEPMLNPPTIGAPHQPMMTQFQANPFAGINADVSVDFEGHLWADISNWTELTPHQVFLMQGMFYGVIIGLQDTEKALAQKKLLLA
jgi:hypothetical protein